MQKFKKVMDRLLEFTTAISMGALVVDVTWQVATRFLLNDPSSWTEEVATYLMIWVGLLGAAVALRQQAHLGIDFFVNKLTPKRRVVAEVLSFALIAFFSISVMMVGGLQLVRETFVAGQVAPATGIPLGYVYIAVPMSGFFITIYTLEFLIEKIAELKSTLQSESPSR